MPFASQAIVDPAALIALGGLLIFAAASDIRARVIPNWLSLAIAALYPLHAVTGGAAWIGGLAIGALLFAIGAGLFAMRAIGGGDVKLMAAIGLWTGPGLALPFLVVMSLAGGVLALIVLAQRQIFSRTLRSASSSPSPLPPAVVEGGDASLPYGVAIAAGGLYVAIRLMIG